MSSSSRRATDDDKPARRIARWVAGSGAVPFPAPASPSSPPQPGASPAADPRPLLVSTSVLTRSGVERSYVFFWRPQEPNGVLSNWYAAAPFVDDEQRAFAHAEQYLMWRKARLFGDEETAAALLCESDPKQCKTLGRQVRGFDEARWTEASPQIMLDGLLLKFRQNPMLHEILLFTGTAVLVEASPHDAVWGIGLEAKHAAITTPALWPGENRLGRALMACRTLLMSETEGAAPPVGHMGTRWLSGATTVPVAPSAVARD